MYVSEYCVLFTAVAMVCWIIFAYGQYRENKALSDRYSINDAFVTQLIADHKQERRELFDRLMARDFSEFKTMVGYEGVTNAEAVSKKQNEKRISEEMRKLVERG
jgi:Mg2+ and Co2+ transporter CorA